MKITEEASAKCKELLKQNPGKAISIFIDGFGWGGPNLGLALEELKEDDKIHKIDNVDFLINHKVLPYTNDKQLDYVYSDAGQGFILKPLFGQGCS